MRQMICLAGLLLFLTGGAVGASQSAAAAPTRGAGRHSEALKQLSAEDQAGILYGDGYAFLISAPKGWILDDDTGRAEGVLAVFYRRGESWVRGKATCYANAVLKRKGHEDTLEKVVQADLDSSRQQDPEMKATPVETMATGDGRRAVVFTLEGPGTGRKLEKIAYIDTPRAVVMLVLTSTDPAAYEKALPDLTQLVRSFLFMADRVTVTYHSTKASKGRKKQQR